MIVTLGYRIEVRYQKKPKDYDSLPINAVHTILYGIGVWCCWKVSDLRHY
jgi:hypothetical protein